MEQLTTLAQATRDAPLRVLVVTHRRVLTNKFCDKDLAHLGFTSHLIQESGRIDGDRVVVCLDSIMRVPNYEPFDYVVLDEAVGVLSQHMSTTMRSPRFVVAHLMNLLTAARHVVFMDAFADNLIVVDYVKELEKTKGARASWVRNGYVRPPSAISRRDLHITTCNDASELVAFTAAAIDLVCKYLQEGRRVYVPSSTKRFVVLLAEIAKRKFPALNIQEYHSLTEGSIKNTALADIDEAWAELHLAAASNALESGSSMERPGHMTRVVAWCPNMGKRAAPVFSILQQMFRVRDLGPDGRMDLFVYDVHKGRPSDGPPTSREEVDDHLARQARGIADLADMSGLEADILTMQMERDEHGGLRHIFGYDTETGDYKLVRDYTLVRNKSIVYWSDIIVYTLRDDYGCDATMHTFVSDAAVQEAGTALAAEARRIEAQTVIPYDASLVVSPEQFILLEHEEKAADGSLTHRQRQSLHLMRRLTAWGIDASRLDEAFYGKYVIMYTDADKVRDQLAAMRRTAYVVTMPLPELAQRFASKMADRPKAGRAIEQYAAKVERFYLPAMHAARLLDAVEPLWREKARADGHSFAVTATSIDAGSKAWLSGITPGAFAQLCKMLDASYTYDGLCGIKESKKAATRRRRFFDRMMECAMGLDVDQSGAHNTRARTYGQRRVSFSPMYDVVEKYQPKKLVTILHPGVAVEALWGLDATAT